LVKNPAVVSINMPENKLTPIERKAFYLVIGFSFLIFFAQTRSFKLLFDGLTYVALAKNILKSGDWSVLHYGSDGYGNFYQHPPLAIWLQALVFKIIGFSEPVSRIIGSLTAVFSVAAVFLFSRKVFGLSAAIWSSVVLFTSTRFIKWASNFYLDGIMAFFLVSGFFLWLLAIRDNSESTPSDYLKSFISGTLFSLGFMTKGVVAFSVLPISILGLILFRSGRNLNKFIFLLIGISSPLLVWFIFFDGWVFLQNYLKISVSGRTQFDQVRLDPWNNLKLWFPWAMFFVFCLFRRIKSVLSNGVQSLDKLLFLILVIALSYPIAFSSGKQFLEHYLTPFYPFGAILAGYEISNYPFFKKVTDRGIMRGFSLLLFLSLLIATVAPSFHVVDDKGPALWLNEINRLDRNERSLIKNIAFTKLSSDIWFGMAVIRGKSDFETLSEFDPSQPSMNDTLLFTAVGEVPHVSWMPANCIYVPGFRAYKKNNLNICLK
jgi:4-amino-4-deoxy-L-arabinose transferase-like glycosyltransferase